MADGVNIREELCRFIRLNYAEQWVPAHIALEQLERFGDDLIPGLIECLNDRYPEVRDLAVELLSEARPRSNVAVPDLIARLDDEDWVVVTGVIFHIKFFGPIAAAAIPQIEPWLESPNEYSRLMAAVTIIHLDPSRTEFLPTIREATMSDHPSVKRSAREFFEEPWASDR